jgi:serine/threonine-protein kinase
MADSNSDNSNFLRIVYTKVKTNGQTELVPIKLYTDVPIEEIALPAVTTIGTTTSLGALVSNRYFIHQVLGQGGFGRTYLASDQHCFNKACVLKEFLPNLIAEKSVEKSRDLFKREARILYQFAHPQIPKFIACFEENGRLFLVQEYVEGKTYSDLLKERLQQYACAFSATEVIQWLKNLLPVLEYIHQHNIIHRDISPDNIILRSDNNLPVLIDFGVGKTVEQDITKQTYIKQQSVVGKMGYAPHEQICMGQCFPNSDLYALGVTAIVLLTGKTPDILQDRYSLEWEWHKHTKVDCDFAQVMDKMLAHKPKERFQSAKDVLAALGFSGTVGMKTDIQEPVELPTQIQKGYSLHPSFLEFCQRELAELIGPIAGFLIQEVLRQNPEITAQVLIETIAEKIPEPQKAIAFRHRFYFN